jgi:hypothetical protein
MLALGFEMLKELEKSIKANDEKAVQDAIFNLGHFGNYPDSIPDEIPFGLIDILRKNEMKSSPLAGYILNYFEFEASYLSEKAKGRCVGFLNASGGNFKHVHSAQVVAELREGDYLK